MTELARDRWLGDLVATKDHRQGTEHEKANQLADGSGQDRRIGLCKVAEDRSSTGEWRAGPDGFVGTSPRYEWNKDLRWRPIRSVRSVAANQWLCGDASDDAITGGWAS